MKIEASLMLAGSRPGSRGPFVSAKGPKTMLAVAWQFGCPAPCHQARFSYNCRLLGASRSEVEREGFSAYPRPLKGFGPRRNEGRVRGEMAKGAQAWNKAARDGGGNWGNPFVGICRILLVRVVKVGYS